MVLGIGVDLVKVSRIATLVSGRHSTHFLQRVLHPSELAVLRTLDELSHSQYVAGCWAAKEAVYKTLDAPAQRAFEFRKWYRYAVNGRPAIALDGVTDEFLLSISHDDGMLVATVLRQRPGQ